MNNSISRREFFSSFVANARGSFASEKTEKQTTQNVVFPPGAQNYLENCNQCNDCISACPHEAIRVFHGDDEQFAGYPVIEPRTQACYFCEDFPCIESCDTGALVKTKNIKLGLAEIIENNCLPYNGHICRSCVNNCPFPEQAIYCDAEGKPVVNEEICNGCGVCVQVCPSDKIGIRIKFMEEKICLSQVS